MRLFKWVAACLAIALAGVAGVWIFLVYGSHGFSAREKPSGFETFLAHLALDTAIPREARRRNNPVPDSPETQAQARAHWADHCAVCHANDGSGDTEMGRGMYPPPPDMRKKDTQQKSDGTLFHIIENGIRLSGMPAWGGEGDGKDSWKLVRFIRHLPNLTAAEKQEMETLNPKGPDERKEEEEEEKFLKGESTNEPKTKHH